jgi:hypothetical protein
MSLASAMSSLNWTKIERQWYGYGIGTHYKAERKAFTRARRADARREIHAAVAEWDHEGDRMQSGDEFSDWIMTLDEENMSDCGSLWVNDGQVEYHRDYMDLEASCKADRMIAAYEEHDAQFGWDDYDDPWYDDPCGWNDPREDIGLAFDEMERMQDEPEQDESDLDLDWRESLEDERDEWEDMLDSLVPFHKERDVFGHVLTTDDTLTDWHSRKIA